MGGYMLMTRSLVLVVCLVLAAQHGLAAPTDEMVLLERSQAMMQKLVAFTKQKKAKLGKARIEGEGMAQLIIEIEKLLSQEKNPAVLARVALLTRVHVHMRQEANTVKDEMVGEVFVEAWFGCMTNIKRLGGAEALAALDDIERSLSYQTLDGALSLAFKKAREEVEQGIKAKRIP
jgi:hypothetical protein